MSLPPLDNDQDSKLKELWKKTDKRFVVAIAAAIIVLLSVILFSVLSPSDDPENPAPAPTSTASSTPSPSSSPSDGGGEDVGDSEPANPLAKDGVEFPKVTDAKDPVTVKVEGTAITLSQSGSPTLDLADDSNVQAAATPCEVKDTLSYCLVATTQFGSQSFDYFYSRDIAHSKLFRDARDVRQADIAGASSAAFMTIDFGSEERRVLAIAASDSSGYLVTLPEGAGTSTEDTLLKQIALK